jgi:hypothetical protein
MSESKKKIITGLVFVLLLALGYIRLFGLYPRYFDIQWDEEVFLHDGHVIVVHVKRTYERQGSRFKQYDENRIQYRRTELTFESAPGIQQVFTTRLPVAYLGQFNKQWYVVLSTQGPYGNFPDEMPTHWGSDFSTKEQRLAILKEGTFVPISWDAAPVPLNQGNMLGSAFFSELVAWNGTRLSLSQKQKFQAVHMNPGGYEITRPIRFQDRKSL